MNWQQEKQIKKLEKCIELYNMGVDEVNKIFVNLCEEYHKKRIQDLNFYDTNNFLNFFSEKMNGLFFPKDNKMFISQLHLLNYIIENLQFYKFLYDCELYKDKLILKYYEHTDYYFEEIFGPLLKQYKNGKSIFQLNEDSKKIVELYKKIYNLIKLGYINEINKWR